MRLVYLLLSPFLHLQKVNVIAMAVINSIDRKRLFAQTNSFIAIFILAGQTVVTYVVTRPGRELLFTVVSQDEKYKAKVFSLWIITAVYLGHRQVQLARQRSISS